jgi:nucleoside-diphosphate-sugar epimerase
LAARDEGPSGGIYNIGDPRPYSWDEFGRAVGKALGRKPRLVRFPLPLVFLVALMSEGVSALTRKVSILDRNKIREMRQDAWVADMRKAQGLLGFKPEYSLEEALQETVDWYRERRWL